MRQWTTQGRPVIAGFFADGWAFEIFGAAEPVAKQASWRHFEVEQRLLNLGGAFRADLLARRHAGAKTEPPFAAALGLPGDPYTAMLDLADQPDAMLAEMLRSAGFAPVT